MPANVAMSEQLQSVEPVSLEKKTIAIVAGEHSGDILGAGLVKALKCRYPNAEFVGIAGPRMKQLGVKSFFNMEELAVMGIFEVLPKLRRLFQIKNYLVKHFKSSPPDIFIGIDAPDFNLRVSKELKQAGIKTVHYVCPSVWAWRQKRIFKIKKSTDRILALLPFEKTFCEKYDVDCVFVGHTLADDIPLNIDKTAARAELNLGDNEKVLALLPGSRGSEVSLLAEPYLKAAELLIKQIPDVKILVPLVNQKRRQEFEQIKQKVAPALPLTMLDGQSKHVMKAADAILLASGTASLEGMLYKKPMVVGYRLGGLTYWLLKHFFTFNIKYFSLPNLIADQPLIPEYLQQELKPETIASTLQGYLTQPQHDLINTFTELHQSLRLNASNRAAQAIQELVEQTPFNEVSNGN